MAKKKQSSADLADELSELSKHVSVLKKDRDIIKKDDTHYINFLMDGDLLTKFKIESITNKTTMMQMFMETLHKIDKQTIINDLRRLSYTKNQRFTMKIDKHDYDLVEQISLEAKVYRSEVYKYIINKALEGTEG